MGTWRSPAEMEKLHGRFVDGCVRPGDAPRRRRGALPAGRRVRQLRLRQEPRGGVRPDRLRVVVPQALLPGPVPRRAGQRPADGLLPGRGARQRREAPRGRRPAGRRQRLGLPDDDRVGRPAGLGARRAGRRRRQPRPRPGRAAAARAGDRGPAPPGPLAGLRDPGPRRAGALDAGEHGRLGRPARAPPREGDRRGARGAPRRGAGPRAVRVARRRRGADRPARGGRRAAHPGRRARLAGAAAARAPLAAPGDGPAGEGGAAGRRAGRGPAARPAPAGDAGAGAAAALRAGAARRRLRDPLARRAAPGRRRSSGRRSRRWGR